MRSEGDRDMVLIMDAGGYIAGMQSVVMKEKALDDEFIDFSGNPYYVLDAWFGDEAYYLTAYFVNTTLICDGGRTEEEFADQGTGDRLSLQNGPTPSDLQEIPLTKDEISNSVNYLCRLCKELWSSFSTF